MAQEPALFDLTCDDFYLSALFREADELDSEDDLIFPVSDVKYAQGLQLQEALVASMLPEPSQGYSTLNIAANAASSSSSSSSSFKVEQAEEAVTAESGEPASALFDLSCDDFYSSALFFETDELDSEDDLIFAVSDVKYAQGLQLQEALVASMLPEPSQGYSTLNIAANAASSSSSSSFKVEQEEEAVTAESGDSSLSFCEICVDRKESDQMFAIQSCGHVFCNECVSKHVGARLQFNVHAIRCPAVNCGRAIEFDSCRSFMPKDVLEKWDEMLCDAMVDASQKFYCPFKDCSAMLERDSDEVIRESECPVCRRLFCARCYVPWHPGVDCEELLRLNQDERGREDLMLRELAKAKSWNRCPRCKYYVEKIQGCIHMTCRCGFQFCYACGEPWSSTHGGCQQT